MQHAFLPVFLFVLCAVGLAAGMLAVAGLFNPGRPGRVARMPYESGMDPIHDTRRRFDVRFHLLAIAFLVFDVELLFLYPWAVAMRGEERGLGTSVPSRVESTEGSGIRDQGSGVSTTTHRAASINNQQSTINNPSPLSPPQGIDYAVARGWVQNRDLVFGGAMTFLGLLALGFVYDWRKGVFRWR